ncbi:MAG TPA: citrate synthase [Bordetella sp.]|nr:citrate synthase [Bordetella sp.]
MENPDYLTRDEAIDALRIKPATLYAYVSRGLLRRVKDQGGRRSLYLREDVNRLKARHAGHPARTEAASQALRWGEPVVDTGITLIDTAGPSYRGRAASELARSGASFEAVAHLLLTGLWQPGIESWPGIHTPADARHTITADMKAVKPHELSHTCARAVLALGMGQRGAAELAGDGSQAARLIIQTLAGCLGYLGKGPGFTARRANEPVARQILRACGRQPDLQAESAVNQVLIVLADHELATASFVARVAASTHSDLYCCIAAALCAHAGSSTLAATCAVDERLFGPLSAHNWTAMQRLARERGAALFGFNHPLYARGDPRADYILALVAQLPPTGRKIRELLRFVDEARTQSAVTPGIAAALAVFARVLGMPPGAAAALWIISRTAGWTAHALEQRMQGYLLRPRARYVARGLGKGGS